MTKRLKSAQYRLVHFIFGSKANGQFLIDMVIWRDWHDSTESAESWSDAICVAWAAIAINYDDSRLSKVVMHSQMAMASGRWCRGLPHQHWSDTLKASMTIAHLPTYQEGSLNIIGDDWKIKDLTGELVWWNLRTWETIYIYVNDYSIIFEFLVTSSAFLRTWSVEHSDWL